MITLSEKVKTLLNGLDAAVYYFYPQSWTNLPVIAWRESENREIAQADGQEYLAELTYAVDIWAESAAENQALAGLINQRMASARFRRDYMADLFDAKTGFHHRSLRYRAVADSAGNIYQ